jgi:hypothetical protein
LDFSNPNDYPEYRLTCVPGTCTDNKTLKLSSQNLLPGQTIEIRHTNVLVKNDAVLYSNAYVKSGIIIDKTIPISSPDYISSRILTISAFGVTVIPPVATTATPIATQQPTSTPTKRVTPTPTQAIRITPTSTQTIVPTISPNIEVSPSIGDSALTPSSPEKASTEQNTEEQIKNYNNSFNTWYLLYCGISLLLLIILLVVIYLNKERLKKIKIFSKHGNNEN